MKFINDPEGKKYKIDPQSDAYVAWHNDDVFIVFARNQFTAKYAVEEGLGLHISEESFHIWRYPRNYNDHEIKKIIIVEPYHDDTHVYIVDHLPPEALQFAKNKVLNEKAPMRKSVRDMGNGCDGLANFFGPH